MESGFQRAPGQQNRPGVKNKARASGQGDKLQLASMQSQLSVMEISLKTEYICAASSRRGKVLPVQYTEYHFGT